MLLVTLSLVSVLLATNTSCPTWNYYYNSTGACECGSLLSCSNDKVEIRIDHCATSSGQDGDYFIGFCPFPNTVNNSNRMSSEMPSNASQLDEVMCGPYNRRGLLCGECKEGYGPAYSLDRKCAKCSNVWSGFTICLYLTVEFVPATCIFIILAVCRLNITSGPLLGYILFCQTTIALTNYHFYFIYSYMHFHVSSSLRLLIDLLVTVSRFWSLQFFKAIVPPFCISDKLTGIDAHMLNLVPVIYPLILVIISCILMELHAKNYRIVTFLWKPFKIILRKTKIMQVTGDAVFHAFASFILLSNISVMFAVYQMLNYIELQNSSGSIRRQVLYIDPYVELGDSIPYVLTAAVVFICITLVPSLLLCIYPTRVYRYLSRGLSARKRLAITAFAEALHCCFKDGLNGTRDYRALAGVTVFLGGLACLALHHRFSSSTSTIVQTALWIMFVSLVAYMKPCKTTVANISLSFHMALLGIITFAINLWEYHLSIGTYTLELIFTATLLTPHALVALWAGYTSTKYTLTRFGYQFHGPGGPKVTLRDMADSVRLWLCRRCSGYQELVT